LLGAFPSVVILLFETFLFSSQTTKYVGNGDVQGIQLFHFGYGPCTFLPMPTHLGALMAGLAQGHHGVVQSLLYVVSI
jgi:hypothetical protein